MAKGCCSSLCGLCCCCSGLFLFVWCIELLIGEIYYSATWSPKVELSDSQFLSFNISGDSSDSVFNAHLNFTVGAREFSRHPSYETFWITIKPSFRGDVLGSCDIRRRGVGYYDTLLLPCELNIQGYLFSGKDDGTGAALRNQFDNGILLLDVRVIMTIYPRVYLAFSSVNDQTCNLILRPPAASNTTASILRQFCTATPQPQNYNAD